jgi:isoleucyl-tRNA synthetase
MSYPRPRRTRRRRPRALRARRRRVSEPALSRDRARRARLLARDDTFRASIAQRDGAEEWVFYDGPPFANGLPHYGHLLTGYAKDLFPRFQTMRGKKVDRVFGWDTHGLPAELEAMKQLGITEKSEIEQMGIASFNAKARESVLEYTQQWEDYVTRQARWVDFERGYKTLDTGYMESVLWAFKSSGTRASPTRGTACCLLLAR